VPEQPPLQVVIVSYRCETLLRSCLRSLRDHSPEREMSVHVVDNASGDGTAPMVEREFGDVRLTRCARNLGFGAANNLAIRAGEEPYVLALNPDTEITAGALDRLCGLLDERPELGIVGPRLALLDGSFDHAAKRSFPTPLGALGHFARIGRRSSAGRLAQYRATELGEHQPGAVDAVNGAFMLIRRAALEQVGLFDEGYWMYMEDLDLCYRFAEAGWITWYEPSVTVIHAKAGTSGKHRATRLNYAFHYGMLRFYRAHYAPRHSPLYNLTIYIGIAVKFCLSAAASALARLRASRAPVSR
jgi:N-acetylglucosaminyl-diphospho-decaprenol L-rhamnosyltransferase